MITKLRLHVLRAFFEFGLNMNNHEVSSLRKYFLPVGKFQPRNRRFTHGIMFTRLLAKNSLAFIILPINLKLTGTRFMFLLFLINFFCTYKIPYESE